MRSSPARLLAMAGIAGLCLAPGAGQAQPHVQHPPQGRAPAAPAALTPAAPAALAPAAPAALAPAAPAALTPAAAAAPAPARPELVRREVVTGMPRGEQQEVHVYTARFAPGQATVFHSHRFPVTVYILEGAFTLEMEGRAPVVVRAGESFVEPPNVRMTGYNRSATDPISLLIFYVGEPGTPFLDMVH